jgi:hypothetical protein
MSVNGNPQIDQRLCSLTNTISIQMPVLHVTTVLPGDFRTVDEMDRHIWRQS